MKKHKRIKINICLNLKLKSSTINEIVDYSTWGEKTNEGRVILLADNYSSKTNKVIDSIGNRVLQQNAGDSSFVLHRIDFLQLNISKYRPLRGGKYRSFPIEILKKQALYLIKECNGKNYFKVDDNDHQEK